jgi:hypothetical protein
MAKWYLVVAKKSREADTKSTKIQFGDIITYVPEGHKLTEDEKNMCFLIPADGLTENEVASMTATLYEGGITDPLNQWDFKTNGRPPKIIAKRKFKIPLEKMEALVPSFDSSKISSESNYQPFTANDVVTEPTKAEIIYDKYKTAYVTSFTASVGADLDG